MGWGLVMLYGYDVTSIASSDFSHLHAVITELRVGGNMVTESQVHFLLGACGYQELTLLLWYVRVLLFSLARTGMPPSYIVLCYLCTCVQKLELLWVSLLHWPNLSYSSVTLSKCVMWNWSKKQIRDVCITQREGMMRRGEIEKTVTLSRPNEILI